MKKNITLGKLRGLQQISSDRGTFTVLALDHRQNLRKANPVFQDDLQLLRFKLDVIEGIAPAATGVLLDPEVSAAQSISSGVLPGNVGLIVAVESTGYTGEATARKAQIIPGWNVEKAKRMGASAIKLLVYYHPDSPTANEISDFIVKIAEECKAYDLAFMLEPLSYPLSEGKMSSEEKQYVVIETARNLSPLGIDVLKVEFPRDVHENDQALWDPAFKELNHASVVPWILLSAAVDFETYIQQVTAACRFGASGIAVGRAVWKEAVTLPPSERIGFLGSIGKERFIRLKSLCDALAVPFTAYYTSEAPMDWYKTY